MSFSGKQSLKDAFTWLGEELGKGSSLQMTVIGGAAGHLLNLFGPTIMTSDVDVVYVKPSAAVDEILFAAVAVSHKKQLYGGWLNQTDAGLYTQMIPEGWESRRVVIGEFGRLRVFAISRQDLIAMKFFAHRQRDFEHLEAIGVTPQELAFTREYLLALAEKSPNDRNAVEKSLYILAHWGKSDA